MGKPPIADSWTYAAVRKVQASKIEGRELGAMEGLVVCFAECRDLCGITPQDDCPHGYDAPCPKEAEKDAWLGECIAYEKAERDAAAEAAERE